MRYSRPQSIDILFSDIHESGHAVLSKIQQHAMLLLNLNSEVKALLSAPLRPWCRVANVRQGVLVLEAASASWLMRLRYEQAYLLLQLRAHALPLLSFIKIRINPFLAIKGQENAQNTNNDTV